MSSRQRYDLVLSIYPNTRGFAFVLFEGSLNLIDWAVVEVRGKFRNRNCLRRVSELFGHYGPDVVILQDLGQPESAGRTPRIRDLVEAVAILAETQGIAILRYPRDQVQEHFRAFGLTTKQAVAETIARHIPVLERFVPPPRKAWQAQDARMGLFDAAALALTFYGTQQN